MKRTLKYILLAAIIVMTSSCFLTRPKCQRRNFKELFCTPEPDPNQKLFEIWEKEKSEGLKYYYFEGEFYTENQFDSINNIIFDKVLYEMIITYDSINSRDSIYITE